MRNEGKWSQGIIEGHGVGRFLFTGISAIIILLCAMAVGAEADVSVEGNVPGDGYLYVTATSDVVMLDGCPGEPKLAMSATWGWGDGKGKTCYGTTCSMKIDISMRKSATVKLEAMAVAARKARWGDCLIYNETADPQSVSYKNEFNVGFISPPEEVQARKDTEFAASYELTNFDDTVHRANWMLYLCKGDVDAPVNTCRELAEKWDVPASGMINTTADLTGMAGQYSEFVRTCARSCEQKKRLIEIVPCPPEGCCQVDEIEADPTEVYPVLGGGNTKSTITITLKDPAPPDGCTIELKNDPEEGSGGHQHSVNNPPRPRGSLGGKNMVTNNVVNITIPVDKTTGTVAYASSEVSGKEKIKYRIKPEDPNDTKDWSNGVEMTIRVPDLHPICEIPTLCKGIYFHLTGSTSTHPVNHYGTANTIAQIMAVGSGYYVNKNVSIGINDMSLPWGGLFDISGEWARPHKGHRRGTGVDIDKCAKDFLHPNALDEKCVEWNPGYSKGYAWVDMQTMKRICKANGGGLEDENHNGKIDDADQIHCEIYEE